MNSAIRWKWTLAALLLWILFAGAACARQPAAVGDPVEIFSAYLDQRIPYLLDRFQVPGLSMALIQEGELVWSGAYGYADLARGQEMTVDAVCRAESISKSVTAWGVMKLVEDGQLELDVPVQGYLENWQFPQTKYDPGAVTVRLLLSNTAGLPMGTIGEEYSPGGSRPTLEENLAQEAQLIQEPGKGFLYSNPGFNLLELLVEEITDRDFSSFMADEVLRPLGMLDASYTWDGSYQDQLPTGYEMDGSPVPAYVYPAAASGGLFADVEDLARFVSAEMWGSSMLDQPVLDEETVRLLHQPQVEIPGLFGFVADFYGLGHFIETMPDGRTAVWHGGQGHGWMTHFHAVPETGDGIVILTNSQRSWPLIAELLSDWARWNDLGPLKFTIIKQAGLAVRMITGLIFLLAVGQFIWLARKIQLGDRRFAPLAPEGVAGRSAQAFLGGAVLAVLAWSAAQPYLFVSSIFPGLINWLAAGVFFLAVVNLLAACFPGVEEAAQGRADQRKWKEKRG